MKYVASILTMLWLIASSAAYKFKPFTVYGEGLMQVRSCSFTLYKSATFCEKQSPKAFACFCKDINAMASMAGCIQTINVDRDEVFKWLSNYCEQQYQKHVSPQDLINSLDYLQENGKNFTAVKPTNSSSSGNSTSSPAKGGASGSSKALKLTPISKAGKAKPPPQIDYPIFVNTTLARDYYIGYHQFYDNFNWSYWFSNALYAYWLFVFVIAAAYNWGAAIFPGLRTSCNSKFFRLWRKYITLPALVKKKKTNHQEFVGILSFLVPSRLETIILSGFFWLTFLFNALYMDYEEGSPVFDTRYNAVLRYVGDRTGVIGTMLLPLLILIGGRNNFLQWLTRWKFSTFVLYHRWIGRVIVALIFVHSVAYSVIEINAKVYSSFMKKEYIIYGTVGTVAGGVICFQGLLFLRRKFYEVFLAIHILMAVAFLLGAWRHIEMRMFMEWLIASIAIWSFDRFVRIARIVWFGIPKATVTLLADDCLRVVVPKPTYWPSVPGGHAWVYFCHSWFFWQSHPFTFLDSTVEKDKIVFVLKTKRGATHYITKMLSKLPGKTATIRVCVEGPYGESCSVKSHDNVVFVAGGNGIPGIFSECYSLARKSVDNAKQRIKLIWILREILTIEWVWEELHSLKNTKVEATVFITRPESDNKHVLLERIMTREDSSADQKSDEKDVMSHEVKDILDLLNNHFPHITFKFGRPSMDAIVDEETEEATKSAAFITCGHPIMVDDLRYAVVLKIDKTEKRLDFFEQLQVWA